MFPRMRIIEGKLFFDAAPVHAAVVAASPDGARNLRKSASHPTLGSGSPAKSLPVPPLHRLFDSIGPDGVRTQPIPAPQFSPAEESGALTAVALASPSSEDAAATAVDSAAAATPSSTIDKKAEEAQRRKRFSVLAAKKKAATAAAIAAAPIVDEKEEEVATPEPAAEPEASYDEPAAEPESQAEPAIEPSHEPTYDADAEQANGAANE
jgi:hypothetical protein